MKFLRDSEETFEVIEKNGRPVRTRTADLYRVKAASLCTCNNLEGVEVRLNTWKRGQDGMLTGEITGEEIPDRTRCRSKIACGTVFLDETTFLGNWEHRPRAESHIPRTPCFSGAICKSSHQREMCEVCTNPELNRGK